MAQVIQFPSKHGTVDGSSYLDQAGEMVASPGIARKIEGACRAMTGALCRGTVKPDRFFIMYEEKNTIAFLSFSYAPGELLKSINTILEHEGKTS